MENYSIVIDYVKPVDPSPENEGADIIPGFTVHYRDKRARGLTYDEMVGLVTSIALREPRPCLQWLKSTEQEQKQAEYFESLKDKNK